uniref:Uncharacterized protein n=1 Tax=Oryza brachyantha TaxID=4533 RepID=J3M4T8_ORYBR
MDDDNKSSSWGGCKCILKFAWQSVRFWTPLSITFVILWLLYGPDRFHPRVDSGVLAALHLAAPAAGDNATDHQLLYDLAVDLSFRNAHRRLSIRYLDIAATAFYGGAKLGPADDALPSPLLQGPKNTTVRAAPVVPRAVFVDSGTAAELEREMAEATVHVKVNVALTLKYKVWFVADVYFYMYDCWLWFPPPATATPAVFAAGTQCWAVKKLGDHLLGLGSGRKCKSQI